MTGERLVRYAWGWAARHSSWAIAWLLGRPSLVLPQSPSALSVVGASDSRRSAREVIDAAMASC
jgi:hypothetical protein